MRRKQVLPELLAPAGNFEALIAATLAGADAVYLGGVRFGARAYAKNFDEEELSRAVSFCHMFGTRIYVTLNTLIFDKEMNDAVEYAERLYHMGVDALIVADVGVAANIRRKVPDLELHASTQMGAHNTAGVNFAYGLGCKRVVLARECSIDDIRSITERADAECEVFVHGALCVCHSGQCLFSSMVGGRSGNRGECAQPCRLPYNGNRELLSLSDLSLSNHINELIDAGVSSLKIEGRMKSPSYVYEVTRIYRTLLDEKRGASGKENQRLAEVFSRGGFTDAYFRGMPHERMTGMRSEGDKAQSKNIEHGEFTAPKLKIRAKASFALGEPSTLELFATAYSRWDNASAKNSEKIYTTVSVKVEGACALAAESSPLSDAGVKERLSKMGNTPFELSASDIELSLDAGINLAPSQINALRREAAELLLSEFSKKLEDICNIKNPPLPPCRYDISNNSNNGIDKSKFKKTSPGEQKRTSLIFNTDLLEEIIADAAAKDILRQMGVIFVPLYKYSVLSADAKRAVAGVYLPPIIMEREWNDVKMQLEAVKNEGVLLTLVGNISHISLARELGMRFVADFRLNVTNSLSCALYRGLSAEDIILSPELTLPQARDIGGGVITLGRIPLMITERCFIKENFGCDKCSRASLRDRKGAAFPIMREYSHRNIIFNSSVTYMGDKKQELRAAGISHEHFIFSAEYLGDLKYFLSSYAKNAPITVGHRRIGKR